MFNKLHAQIFHNLDGGGIGAICNCAKLLYLWFLAKILNNGLRSLGRIALAP